LFSHLDDSVRARLAAAQRLVALDRTGAVVADGRAHLSVMGPVPVPRRIGDADVVLEWYPFVRRTEWSAVQAAARSGSALHDLMAASMSVNSVFAWPGIRDAAAPLVRLHSCCLTGDVFGSRRCDCGPQLEQAFADIRAAGAGAVVYMSGHEGRGIGLWAKAMTYLLQDGGQDTFAANTALGLPEDSRDFGDAAVVLRYLLRGRPLRLLSNNPDKRSQLERCGQAVSAVVPLVVGVCEHNLRYVRAKRARGHVLPANL
jgi:GTP cyclohydrolase II